MIIEKIQMKPGSIKATVSEEVLSDEMVSKVVSPMKYSNIAPSANLLKAWNSVSALAVDIFGFNFLSIDYEFGEMNSQQQRGFTQLENVINDHYEKINSRFNLESIEFGTDKTGVFCIVSGSLRNKHGQSHTLKSHPIYYIDGVDLGYEAELDRRVTDVKKELIKFLSQHSEEHQLTLFGGATIKVDNEDDDSGEEQKLRAVWSQ
jgi:hypothetical protein